MSQDFYHKLSPFSHFEDFTRTENYHALPDDWLVVVADIKNSTGAIDAGHYKEVNLIGAACITQTMQSLSTQDIPFVFGGDGASLCIPKGDVESVSAQLAKLQKLSQDNFDLTLRVAVIPIQDLRDSGCDIFVAKLEITQGKFIALFRGGGLAEADNLAKQDYEKYAISSSKDNLQSLSGLSCRWSPIPSQKGQVVSLLVMARDAGAMNVYQALISKFREIMGREISEANPVMGNLENYKSVGEAIAGEYKYHQSWFGFSFFCRMLDIVLAVLIFKYRINPIALFYNAGKYKESISTHSDFRKFDDTLRLIIDCSHKELASIGELLNKGYEEGTLFFGLHASEEALMTCFVENTDQGGHLHFVDGGNGGLAMASKQLKMQMASK